MRRHQACTCASDLGCVLPQGGGDAPLSPGGGTPFLTPHPRGSTRRLWEHSDGPLVATSKPWRYSGFRHGGRRGGLRRAERLHEQSEDDGPHRKSAGGESWCPAQGRCRGRTPGRLLSPGTVLVLPGGPGFPPEIPFSSRPREAAKPGRARGCRRPSRLDNEPLAPTLASVSGAPDPERAPLKSCPDSIRSSPGASPSSPP